MTHRPPLSRIITTLAASTALPACAVGPDYEPPKLSYADQYAAEFESVASGDTITAEWWRVFDDPALDDLIARAASDNLDLAVAEARLREARALRGAAVGEFFPDVSAGASVTETELSRNGQLLSFAPPGVDDRLTLYDSGFDAFWELDVFGGKRRGLEAATADLQSAEEERRATMLSVMAEVARNYAELRGAQRRLAITERNAETQKSTLDLIAEQESVGSASRLDVARSESQLASTRSELPRIRAEIRAQIHRLAVLIGDDPQALAATLLDPAAVPAPPDIVPVGLRTDILRRRPDVRAAERRLAAATADVGVAVAELFPSFSLTGAAGFESISFDDWVEASSGTWAVGPALSLPIFRRGQLRAQVNAAEARADAEAALYEQSVLRALEDAETSLVNYAEEIETRAELDEAVATQREAMGLINERFREGDVDFLEVLDTERALLAVEERLVRSETAIATNLVALYKALGGGWEAFEPARQETVRAAANTTSEATERNLQ